MYGQRETTPDQRETTPDQRDKLSGLYDATTTQTIL